MRCWARSRRCGARSGPCRASRCVRACRRRPSARHSSASKGTGWPPSARSPHLESRTKFCMKPTTLPEVFAVKSQRAVREAHLDLRERAVLERLAQDDAPTFDYFHQDEVEEFDWAEEEPGVKA